MFKAVNTSDSALDSLSDRILLKYTDRASLIVERDSIDPKTDLFKDLNHLATIVGIRGVGASILTVYVNAFMGLTMLQMMKSDEVEFKYYEQLHWLFIGQLKSIEIIISTNAGGFFS